MEVLEKEIGFEQLGLMQRRLEILVGGRISEREKMKEAGKAINRLTRRIEGFKSVEEIRKWRERGVHP
ncbi:MAG: hypothetical protein AB1397_06800 [bacterium]